MNALSSHIYHGELGDNFDTQLNSQVGHIINFKEAKQENDIRSENTELCLIMEKSHARKNVLIHSLCS